MSTYAHTAVGVNDADIMRSFGTQSGISTADNPASSSSPGCSSASSPEVVPIAAEAGGEHGRTIIGSMLRRSPALRGAGDMTLSRPSGSPRARRGASERSRSTLSPLAMTCDVTRLSSLLPDSTSDIIELTCTCDFNAQAKRLKDENTQLRTMIKEMVERWKREQTTTKEYVKKLHMKIDEEEKCSSAQSNIDSQIANLMQKKETVQREVTVAESNLREMQDLHTATKMQLMQFHERRAEEMNSRDLGRRAEDAERIPLLEQQISVYMEDWKSERTDKERALVKANELEQKVEQMQNMLKHYQDAEDAYNEVRRRSSAHRDVLRSAAYPTGRDHDVVRRSGSYVASGDSFRRSGSHNSSVLEYNIPMSASNQACVVSRGTSPVVTVRCNLSPRASLYVTDDLDFDSTPGATGTSSPRITTPCGSRAASVSPRHSTIIVEDVTSDKEDVYGAPPDNERFLHCPKCTRPYPENRHDELVEHFELCSEVDH